MAPLGAEEFDVSDYEIGGLTKVMSMLKMHEEIVVHVDLVFEPSAAPASQARSTTAGKPITARWRY